ncbi:MAG: hypothetical protein U0350_06010 [Caldilineaceae bacterium]
MSESTKGMIPVTVITNQVAQNPGCLEWVLTVIGIVVIFGAMVLMHH